MTKLPRWIVYSLIAAIGSCCTIFCITTGFSISVNVPVIIFAALVFSAYFAACFSWRKFLWSLIPAALILLFLVFFTEAFASVKPTATQLIHDILMRFSTAYPNYSFVIPEAPDPIIHQSNTLLFVVLLLPVSLWMAWGIGFRSCLISIAGTLPALLLCVIINDTPPNALPLTLLISVWVVILFSRERQNDIPAMDAVRITLTFLAIVLVLGIVGVVYPKDDTRNQQLPELVERFLEKLPGPMQSMLDRNSTGNSQQDLGADTGLILDLTTQGTRNRTDALMLELSATESGVLYLRGAAKDIYTGTSWESTDDATEAGSVYAHTSLGTAFGNITQAAVQIKNYNDNQDILFVPYGFISCTSADPIVSDLRIGIHENNYIVYYWPGIRTLDIASETGYSNTAYDQYVYDTCLSMPEDTRLELYDLALRYGYDPSMDTAETIAWVAEFIRSSGEYKLNVSRQPVNYDFAVYFLEESRQGYCVHFATAAAAMYRALGIPSRYASGYRAVVTQPGEVVKVTDRDTHAWAEIYLSGLGWIPIETTPGFGETSSLPEVKQDIPDEPMEPPEETQEPAEIPAEPSASEEPMSPSPSPSMVPKEAAPETTDSGGAIPAAPKMPWYQVLLLVLLALMALLLLTVIVLIIRMQIIAARRKKAFADPNCNQAVLARWQYLEALTSWGLEIPDTLEALALKAKFSQHTITPEEFTPYQETFQRLALEIAQQQTGLRKLRFRYLSCLTLPKKG